MTKRPANRTKAWDKRSMLRGSEFIGSRERLVIGSRNYRKIIVFPTSTISEFKYGGTSTRCLITYNIKKKTFKNLQQLRFFLVPICFNNFVCFWLACLDPPDGKFHMKLSLKEVS